jgi:RHS repeat-associated protein
MAPVAPSIEAVRAPTVELPKGGGAIRGIGESFAAHPANGTGSLTVPIRTSQGRGGIEPNLSLRYDTGAGNGPFGLGWSLAQSHVVRRTDLGLPSYDDAAESDTILLGSDEVVPVLDGDAIRHDDRTSVPGYRVQRYRPRLEGAYARIERWTRTTDGDVHWRVLSAANVLTVYGSDAGSRIADPSDPARVFSWLLCQVRDDRGNAVSYEYKAEDGAGADLAAAHQRNRGSADSTARGANRYLKRVRYGNRAPILDADGTRPRFFNPGEQNDDVSWMFEVVLDYGEHDPTVPRPVEDVAWSHRPDGFSSYRAGFEIRTARRCRRILMFHHFPDEPEVGSDCLVRSTDLTFADELDTPDPGTPAHSLLASVSGSGYRRVHSGYLRSRLPELELSYGLPVIADVVGDVDAGSLENLPAGLEASYEWIDLFGEGAAGVLTEQADSWYYKRNLGPISGGSVALAPTERLRSVPNRSLVDGHTRLLCLTGDGVPDVVALDGPAPGFHTHDETGGWLPFRPFAQPLPRDPATVGLRFLDLDGDGHADALLSEDEAFRWYPSTSVDGFGAGRTVPHPLDEESGPRLVLDDADGSVYLADLNGDGLVDLVRVRNGEVCYWPSLGFGRFGAKVTMDLAPRFDRPDTFDQRRIRMADVDGDGAADLIYLDGDGVTVYLNDAGNRWATGRRLSAFPAVDDLASVQVTDLMGNGTACLVWSSPAPVNADRPMRYVDLMGGQKPYLLVGVVNNLGAETRLHYTPSTRFALADRLAGRPWIGRLPMPVQVVDRVDVLDYVSGNRFVSRYAYHHGYFDGPEREFRGFGMVEQWDTEEFSQLTATGELADATNVDESSHVPPMLTRSWFHLGAVFTADDADDPYADEYFRPSSDPSAPSEDGRLGGPLLPDGLGPADRREAIRALKGQLLRREVYAVDGSDQESLPYSVTSATAAVRMLQPAVSTPGAAGSRHPVFCTHPREGLTVAYERDPDNPRTVHTLTLEVDDFGQALLTATVGYGRLHPDPDLSATDQDVQAELVLTSTQTSFTNPVDQTDNYRVPAPAESRSYQLAGIGPDVGASRFGFEHLAAAVPAAVPLAYEDAFTTGRQEKRLHAHVVTRYRPDDLGSAAGDVLALLPPGRLEPMALPGESYQLALTAALVARNYAELVDDAVLTDEAGYVHQQDSDWWLRSGRAFASPDPTDDAVAELAYARRHFFGPRRFRDPFDAETVVTYDDDDLAARETRDALGNTTSFRQDYRVGQPRMVTDPNGNRAQVAFDTLGLVVGTAVMGKDGETLGDSLVGFTADLDDATIQAHLADPLSAPQDILQDATTRSVYDLFAYQRTRLSDHPDPVVSYSVARDTHVTDVVPGATSRLLHALAYSDGLGREIQRTSPAPTAGWIVAGWTIYNNVGKPVRHYEPFFTATHGFESGRAVGVSPLLCYDPAGRVVATLHPNHTWDKVVVDPWREEVWDVNDTVADPDPADDVDVGDLLKRLPVQEYLPTWATLRADGALGSLEQAAASKALAHAGTPTVSYQDALGRAFLTLAHNRPGDAVEDQSTSVTSVTRTRTRFDVTGNPLEIVDALERVTVRYDYDLLGRRINSDAMDAGRHRTLADVAGRPLYSWDSRGHRLRTTYDALGRPVATLVQTGTSPEVLVGRISYGESVADAEAGNLRTRPHQAFDRAGVLTTAAYDVAGNPTRSVRQLRADYRDSPDWNAEVALEPETYTLTGQFDAVGRPVTQTGPDGSVVRRHYDAAGLPASIDVSIHGDTVDGSPVWTPFVTDIQYNALGQRTRIAFGNGVSTEQDYDPLTFRLTSLRTNRGGQLLQDLSYIYDPAGNISHRADAAQQSVFFRNAKVDPSSDYLYDALYRLVGATGREHVGQLSAPTPPAAIDSFHTGLDQPGDSAAMATYVESYDYDAVGNLLRVDHLGSGSAHPGWTCAYTYAEPSLLDPDVASNRLSSTTVGTGPSQVYSYDEHGSMTSMPHLSDLAWDDADRLQFSSRQVVTTGQPETTWYVYDGAGHRIRKVTDRAAGVDGTTTRRCERLYLPGYERYREYGADGVTVTLERETVEIMDGSQRVAVVENRTRGDDGSPARLIRYQTGDHLSSAALELDAVGEVITYEEFYPYGGTSYQARNRALAPAAKRYRYAGEERDEETGLDYYGARYYAPFLGRWISTDPAGTSAGLNLYEFTGGNPIRFVEVGGSNWAEAIYNSAATWAGDTAGRAGQAVSAVGDTLAAQGSWALDKASHPIDTTVGLMSMHPLVQGAIAASQPNTIAGRLMAFATATPVASMQIMGGAVLGGAQSIVAIGSIPRNEVETLWHVATGSPAPTRTMRASLLNRPSLLPWTGGGVDTTLTGPVKETVHGAEMLGAGLVAGELMTRSGLFPGARPQPTTPIGTTGLELQAALDSAGGTTSLTAAPGKAPAVTRINGSSVTFDSVTTQDHVQIAMERIGAQHPGAQVWIGSATHGELDGLWAMLDRSLAEPVFLAEDIAATAAGKMPTIGARWVFDMSTRQGAADFEAAMQVAQSMPPGHAFTIKAWCYSSLAQPLASMPPAPPALFVPVNLTGPDQH